MLIDVHTHVFPDILAEKAIRGLINGIKEHYDIYHLDITNKAEGTVSSLIKSMDESGCDKSVICPVVTNEKSTVKTNEFSWSQGSDRIIPFASFMPFSEGWEKTLDDIAERGFKGVKLHPEFQDYFIDDERSIEVLKRIESLGLIVILHSGKDPGYSPPSRCNPFRLAKVLQRVNGAKMIAGHLGGWQEWGKVKQCLLGAPIYFDTSFIAGFIEPQLCKEIIVNHGVDKILFGSDFPWQTSGEVLAFINSLGLTEEEKQKIFHQNAQRLLKL